MGGVLRHAEKTKGKAFAAIRAKRTHAINGQPMLVHQLAVRESQCRGYDVDMSIISECLHACVQFDSSFSDPHVILFCFLSRNSVRERYLHKVLLIFVGRPYPVIRITKK